MIESLLMGVCLLVPQGGQAGTGRVVSVDENGWPVYETTGPESDESATEKAPTPAAPSVEITPLPIKTKADVASPLDLDSPLRDVFRRVGQPADMRDLRGVTAWYEFIAFDHRGSELVKREVTHEADMAFDQRDRLLMPGRKVYGRDGAAVYAELHRLPMPSYEAEAADELALLGLLLRTPWVFADDQRFRVMPETYVMHGRKRVMRIDIVAKPPAGTTEDDAPRDRYELFCDPHTFDPFEIRYTLASTGIERRVLLSDYERIGAARLPMRRTIVDESGNATLEWRLLRVDSGLRFARSQFRPMAR